MNKYAKFALLIAVVLGTLGWLAFDGMSGSMTYYKEIAEIQRMGDDAVGKRLRVAGDVKPASIQRDGREVRFVITQLDRELNVVYDGAEPLPDTFRDRAQALADGQMGPDGVFHAKKIQAKCASKYEAKPGEGARPVYESTPASDKLVSETRQTR